MAKNDALICVLSGFIVGGGTLIPRDFTGRKAAAIAENGGGEKIKVREVTNAKKYNK